VVNSRIAAKALITQQEGDPSAKTHGPGWKLLGRHVEDEVIKDHQQWRWADEGEILGENCV